MKLLRNIFKSQSSDRATGSQQQPSKPKSIFKKRLKRISAALGIVLLIALLWNYQLVVYGIGQARGQLRVIYNTRPVDQVLADPEFPDTLKTKLRLIGEIKQFAEDSIGLNPSENYSTLYDQKGKPILWNVTACKPYELEAYEWTFPFLGAVSYKGFFDHEKAQQEEKTLKEQGYDTDIGRVSAWSTLGYLKDPVLSNMLLRREGSLANLIIHELTHGTLYVKDNVTYNENLASFVGDEGASRFLKYKYGADSKQYEYYQNSKLDDERFSEFVLQGATVLDSLYKTFDEKMPETLKKQKKQEMMERIVKSMDTLQFSTRKYHDYFREEPPNNTFFMDFVRYRKKQNMFREQFNNEFKGDFKAYFAYLKSKYKSV